MKKTANFQTHVMGFLCGAFLVFTFSIGAASCSGDDGQDGRVYGIVTWTADVTAADFSQIGAPPPLIFGEKRELTPGSGTIFWTSSGITYFLFVVIEAGIPGESGDSTLLIIPDDGGDGQDRIYDALISGNTLFFDERIVPIGTSNVKINNVLDAPLNTDNSIPGRGELN